MTTQLEARNKLFDPKYFIERFLFIVNKERNQVPFKFNQPQLRYYTEKTDNDLILKARKEGFSSLITAEWLHACLFGKNENCVTMAHTWDDTVIHLERVRYYLDTMGVKNATFEVTMDKDNQREIFFPHSNSRYWIGTAGSKAFGRGRDITKLHLSEVAHYEDQTVLTAVMEACVPGARIVLETTANGVGEAFHRLWTEAEDPMLHSPWKQHFFAWWEDPGNRLALPPGRTFTLTAPEKKMKALYTLDDKQVHWHRWKKSKAPDMSKFPQEHPSSPKEAFIHSGRPAFNLEKLSDKKERIKGILPIFQGEFEDDGAKIKTVADPNGRLRIWKVPRRGQNYVITGDPAEGVVGADFAVMQILDRESWEQVAVWRGYIDPGDFGREMVKAGVYYNNAVLLPELNNHGWATVEAIDATEYEHLITSKDLWGDKETVKRGWPQSEKTRNYLITALRKAIDEDTIYFNDAITLTECETFIWHQNTEGGKGRFQAQVNCHDDCVISIGIAAYALGHLVLDKTYGEHTNRPTKGSPLRTSSVVRDAQSSEVGRRRSATGYR
jgi:hypothetical protein